MNSDFKELLQLLFEEGVRYLVVGGYAVIYHGQPRSTNDLDIWLEPTEENAKKVLKAFQRFGLPLMGGVQAEDFAKEGLQYAVGVPPTMIDFLTTIPGVEFHMCWENRSINEQDGVPTYFISKSDLLQAKKTAGRAKDLADIEDLEVS